MAEWHHCLSGLEFEQTLGDSGGQRSLASSMEDMKDMDWHAAVHGVAKSQT